MSLKCKCCGKDINEEQAGSFDDCCNDKCMADWDYSASAAIEDMRPLDEDEDI